MLLSSDSDDTSGPGSALTRGSRMQGDMLGDRLRTSAKCLAALRFDSNLEQFEEPSRSYDARSQGFSAVLQIAISCDQCDLIRGT